MPSLFDGTDKLICDALGIQRRKKLNHRTLRIEPLSDEIAFSLVNGLYEQMIANFSGQPVSQSEKLWCCRREPEIRDDNLNKETILEKAVAILAEEGHMPEWFNQCPVASGITDPYKDRRRAVDLIHLSDVKARLIELKWASNTPAHALFQILEYGLAYVFARLHMRELHLEKRRLMQVEQVQLEVVGPRDFFDHEKPSDLFARMDKAVGKFAKEKTGGALSMSLRELSFPARFYPIPFKDGRTVKEKCRNGTLSREGTIIRDAFSRLEPADITPRDRFLPGVPGDDIERILNAAPGNEIESGKFDHPESSAALAVNAFGFFLHRAADLPLLPGCERVMWPASSLSVETTVRFPWSGGHHPVLDCLVVIRSALIGIECKRFEPFRNDNKPASFSDAYWRRVWGRRMSGYERVRDSLRENGRLYSFLNAAQLVKHAFALHSEVYRPKPHYGLKPTLLYVYAEPEFWPGTGRRVADSEKLQHRDEIARFADFVAGDEVTFLSCSYRRVLEIWLNESDHRIRSHAEAVIKRFSP